MSKLLGKITLTEDKEIAIELVEAPSILDIRLSLLFQNFIPISKLSEYLIDKQTIKIKVNNKSAGYIFLYKGMCETSLFHSQSYIFDYTIKKKYRNHKIGQNALKLLFSKEVSEELNCTRYIAYICIENVLSIKCAEKLGMKKKKMYYIKDIEY